MNPSDKARYGELPPVLCERCGRMLHRALIAAGFTRHPLCDPNERAWRWKRERDA
jgi:hypothetical protein